MKFKYRRLRDKSGTALQHARLPLLPVRLAYGGRHIDLVCLIDSGAGDCLFDAEVADELGIDVESGEEREYFGFNGQGTIGYVHPVRLQVYGFSEWIDLSAGFIEGLPVSLLGQSGFFDSYEVSFMRYRGRFELKSRTFLHTH